MLERPARPFDAGSAFVLAAGGLRRLHGRGEAFAGYTADELFWRDVLELVHEEDLPRVGSLLSEVIESPGTSLVAVGARLRDVSGRWTTAEFTIVKVLEAHGDTGLVVADVRATRAPHAYGPRADGQG
ncbi:MAG TPA: PAS domain-containing protein [Rubrobacter sp.]|nr:PAS domain-containing protein [Rubrobacter sp.]